MRTPGTGFAEWRLQVNVDPNLGAGGYDNLQAQVRDTAGTILSVPVLVSDASKPGSLFSAAAPPAHETSQHRGSVCSGPVRPADGSDRLPAP